MKYPFVEVTTTTTLSIAHGHLYNIDGAINECPPPNDVTSNEGTTNECTSNEHTSNEYATNKCTNNKPAPTS